MRSTHEVGLDEWGSEHKVYFLGFSKFHVTEQTKEQILQTNTEKIEELELPLEKKLILTNEQLTIDQLIILMQCEEAHTHTTDHLLFMAQQPQWSIISALSVYFKNGGTLEKAQEIISKDLSEIQKILLLEKQLPKEWFFTLFFVFYQIKCFLIHIV